MEEVNGKSTRPTQLNILPNPITYNSFLSTSPSSSNSPPSSYASPTPSPPHLHHHVVVMSPCAACKILRRRCSAEKCVLAPYFPPTDPLKFTIAHRVFGASNIIKFLQELPESQRADAVSSMVYEANARLRDPVYGSAGAVCNLQRQVSELQAELAKAQAEIVTIQLQKSNLLALLCMDAAAAAAAAALSDHDQDDQFDVMMSRSYGQKLLDDDDMNQQNNVVAYDHELYGIGNFADNSFANNLESLWA